MSKTFENHARFSRRTGLGLGLAAAAAGLAPARAATPDANMIYRKLRYRGDEGLVFWWMSGTKYGQIGPQLTALYDMQVGSLVRVRNTPDGGYDATSLELVFYTDLKTGAFMREWTNPYTGQVIPVKHAPVGPTTIHHTTAGEQVMPKELGGAKLNASSVNSAPLVVGDDIWIKHDATAEVMSRDGKSAPFRVNDWSTYLGKAAEVMDAKVQFAQASVYLQEVTSWQRWMNMGEREGGLTARAVGRKVKSYGEMPEFWRKLVAEIDPDVAKDPVGVLDRPAAEFVR